MIIAEYNLDDEIIDFYENYKDMAKEYQTSLRTVHCMVCRQASGKIDKSFNKTKGIWTKLYKIDTKDDENGILVTKQIR